MSLPVLLLDVDGVLAPWGEDLGKAGFGRHRFGADSDVWLRPADGERLRTLADRFEIIWCTARMTDVAETIAVVLGLPGLEVMPFDRDQLDEAGLRWVGHNETNDGTWKLPWVHQRVQGRAAVWIDDDLRPDVHDWAAHRSEATLILEPSSNIGLTEEHWAALERFPA